MRISRTKAKETGKSSNVYVVRRPLPVVVLQPCDFGGVTKVIRKLPRKTAFGEIHSTVRSPSTFLRYKIATVSTVAQ